ncbi:hypothetical protein NC651_006166 [Populus alba x Populus x berolinensis]|nr:hypothetical protein NC651_006166 [Populus alba x Populus x berolinensis]
MAIAGASMDCNGYSWCIHGLQWLAYRLAAIRLSFSPSWFWYVWYACLRSQVSAGAITRQVA